MKECAGCGCLMEDEGILCCSCLQKDLKYSEELYDFYGNGDNCRSDYKEGEI